MTTIFLPRIRRLVELVLFSSVLVSVVFAGAAETVPAPVLSPEEALEAFEIEDGFRIELVAAEPLVQTPVAMAFDPEGRIWIAEMRGYMPDFEGVGEDRPTGRIVILEDANGDGRMDRSEVFLDGLVLPRVVTLAHGGLVYSTPPELWHVEILPDNKPGKKTLIDAEYAVGGNVEHQPNSFLRNLDNWFYNAKSDVRYRYREGVWETGATTFRGQWGLAQDDYGRLFYNTNSVQILGDYVRPNLLAGNPVYDPSGGLVEHVVTDQRVFPLHPTGVNRGYKEGILEKDGKLSNFTAACGPVIYRGDQFPDSYRGNAFVCEPAANLIKRNVLDAGEVEITGKQAYENQEFLATTDERFRPVNAYNGPDGALYIVDMYRGVIQHKTYLTPYLRDHLDRRKMEGPLDRGRIYRIVHEGSPEKGSSPGLAGATVKELCRALAHANGWRRDTAQRLLVERGGGEAVPYLKKLIKAGKSPLAQVHAMWVLEGLGAVSMEAIRPAFKSRDAQVVATAVHLCERFGTMSPEGLPELFGRLQMRGGSRLVKIQLAATLAGLATAQPGDKNLRLLGELLKKEKGDKMVVDAVMGGIVGREPALLALAEEDREIGDGNFRKMLATHIEKGAAVKQGIAGEPMGPKLKGRDLERFHEGEKLYQVTCMGCHQKDGKGMMAIAPPLVDSEWVSGSDRQLAGILLQGLSGPVEVNGKLYKAPEVQPVMPGLKANTLFTDEKLAAIMTYVRNAWGNRAPVVDAGTPKEVRKELEGLVAPLTADEVRALR